MSASRIDQANRAMEKYHGHLVTDSPALVDIDSGATIGRYLVMTASRDEIWATLADTLDQAEKDLAGQIMEEIAWTPVEVVDLDSGDILSATVSCSLTY